MRGKLYKTFNDLISASHYSTSWYKYLIAEENPESTAQNYTTLVKKTKTETNLVSVSQIIPLNGNFNLQAVEVNNLF